MEDEWEMVSVIDAASPASPDVSVLAARSVSWGATISIPTDDVAVLVT